MAKKEHHKGRLARHAASKAKAENDGQPWGSDELDVLRMWDGSEAELAAVAELLGRTIEACRERFYKDRRGYQVTRTTTTVTRTTEVYRGWTVDMGDGWD